METTSTKKGIMDFWDRPEGTTGTIFIGALVIAALFGAYHLMPYILSILQNTFYALLFGTGIVLTVGLLMNKRFQNLCWAVFTIAMKKATGFVIEMDPIAIIEGYMEKLRDSLENMSTQIARIKSEIHKLKELIRENEKQIENSLKLASQAKQSGNNGQMLVKSRNADRIKDSNVTYQEILNKSIVIERVLTKMYENSELLIEDMTSEIEVKKKEREVIKRTHSAIQSAQSIINGDPDKKVLFDLAMESIADDVALKVGEIERFMDVSKNFMESMDLQNQVFQEDGLKMLEQWEKESTSKILGNTKDTLINKQPVSRIPDQNAQNDYLNILNK